ncbi:MAG: NADH-quinone oxidoreductase subunit L [Chloroflexi bacterium]|nr:NADH-quinone oxidoreductase subunit L [Chloroflexota bacterium]
MNEIYAWSIFFIPVISFLIIGLVIRPFYNKNDYLSGYITILAVGCSLLLSFWALYTTSTDHDFAGWDSHHWFQVSDLEIRVGFLMNNLTSIMLIVVTGVSFVVQVYSQGYMKNDPGYSRYYAVMSLFTASMIGLVIASSILQLFVFWELVGLSSYLLIGFWFERPSASRAAVKAFLVTRLGDIGFIVAILFLFLNRSVFLENSLNPFEIPDIYSVISMDELSVNAATLISLGLFAGAAGKSAQFPLHVWLPDAMEGPTPVSALIHAATMVAAGVFLIGRMFPIFEIAPFTMQLMMLIGAITVVVSASMGMVMDDIKRVVAYSTISQLGYMVLALGVGAYGAALFHLFNHAFFKALLFLGAGNVSHATGTFNMKYMGGFRKIQPYTYVLFIVASLSLSGIFPLAGFWSKDEILIEVFHGSSVLHNIVFVTVLLGIFMTAFYIFRALFMTFHGEFRGGIDQENLEFDVQNDHQIHLAEAPKVMLLPMIPLGILAIISGILVNSPSDLGPISAHWLGHILAEGNEFHAPSIDYTLVLVSTLIAVLGIILSWLIYSIKVIDPQNITYQPLYKIIRRKYYMDDFFENFITKRVFTDMIFNFIDWFDRTIVDGFVDRVGWFGRNIGKLFVKIQSGQVQVYGMFIIFGIIIISVFYFLWR